MKLFVAVAFVCLLQVVFPSVVKRSITTCSEVDNGDRTCPNLCQEDNPTLFKTKNCCERIGMCWCVYAHTGGNVDETFSELSTFAYDCDSYQIDSEGSAMN